MIIREAAFPKTLPNGKPTSEYLLHTKAIEHFNNGGSLHEIRKSLPFYEDMKSVIKKYKKRGIILSNREALELVGIYGYSDTYFAFSEILDLPKFKSEEGFVDSYRKDGHFAGQMGQMSKILEMPESLIIELVGNENLKTSVLHTDVVSYLRQSMQNYLNETGSFENVKRDAPQLYELMRSVKRNIPTPDGVELSMGWFAHLLGFSSSTHRFEFNKNSEQLNLDEIMSKYIQKLDNEERYKISVKDISSVDYTRLQRYAQKNNIPFETLFNNYALEYVNGINVKHLQSVQVKHYPYINEMREERDRLFETFANQNNDLPEEYLFEEYLKICQSVYEKYKDKIHTFNTDPNYTTDKLIESVKEFYKQKFPELS